MRVGKYKFGEEPRASVSAAEMLVMSAVSLVNPIFDSFLCYFVSANILRIFIVNRIRQRFKHAATAVVGSS
jgi:uncharacterized protein YybS (DUF2232 family)